MKFLFFAHHRCLLDAAEATMRGAKADFIRIDGETAVSKRQALVEQVQARERALLARSPPPFCVFFRLRP